MESLSAYARQFLLLMEKPDVDHIEGLSPAISIEQKSTSHNPRSTVGTITEIYDHLRLLFARVGEPRCPTHAIPLAAQTISQMVDQVLAQPEGSKLMLLAPVVRDRKGSTASCWRTWRLRVISVPASMARCVTSRIPSLELHKKHTIEVVVDRFKVREDLALRLAESFETALTLRRHRAGWCPMDGRRVEPMTFSANLPAPSAVTPCPELEPRISFNNPAGACPTCDGLGVQQYFDPRQADPRSEPEPGRGAIRGWDKRSFITSRC